MAEAAPSRGVELLGLPGVRLLVLGDDVQLRLAQLDHGLAQVREVPLQPLDHRLQPPVLLLALLLLVDVVRHLVDLRGGGLAGLVVGVGGVGVAREVGEQQGVAGNALDGGDQQRGEAGGAGDEAVGGALERLHEVVELFVLFLVDRQLFQDDRKSIHKADVTLGLRNELQ